MFQDKTRSELMAGSTPAFCFTQLAVYHLRDRLSGTVHTEIPDQRGVCTLSVLRRQYLAYYAGCPNPNPPFDVTWEIGAENLFLALKDGLIDGSFVLSFYWLDYLWRCEQSFRSTIKRRKCYQTYQCRTTYITLLMKDVHGISVMII